MATNLYSVQFFKVLANSTETYQTELLTSATLSTHDFQSDELARIQALTEGESSVIRNGQAGVRITRLPDYRTNRICFDDHAKEYVMVSNGKCILDHSSADAFHRSHWHENGCHKPCEYAPSEAIALRVFVDNGKATCAWTHRAVNPCDLRPVTNEAEIKAQFEAVLSHKRTSRFIGRI